MNISMSQDKIFTTRELGLAAALVAVGHENVGLDIQYEGRRNQAVGYFAFKDTAELAQDVDDYWKEKPAKASFQKYHAALRSLKSRVTDAVNR